ncbi:hypothetical protein [Micromonospora sp. NPDC005174]|uniref:hypothetical protein n=1 Tax=Micromonospora sp. NPDC005174 TaxID=3157018 RepID=UPI0033A1CA44
MGAAVDERSESPQVGRLEGEVTLLTRLLVNSVVLLHVGGDVDYFSEDHLRNQPHPEPPLWLQAAETAGASVLREMNAPWLPALAGIWAASVTLFAYAPVATAISRRLRGERRANVVEELFTRTMLGVYPGAKRDEQRHHPSRSKSQDRSYEATFQRRDPLHSTAVYTVVVRDLLRIQELFYRRLNHPERIMYCRDANERIAAQLAPDGRSPQTYEELDFHHQAIVERQITVDRQFFRLYETFSDQQVAGAPISELTPVSAPALPPVVVDALGLVEATRAPFPTLAPYHLTAHAMAVG